MRNILPVLLMAIILSGSKAGAQTLLHYWNFNTTSSHQAHLTPSSSSINGAAIDTFLFSGGSSLVDVAGGTGQGFDANNYNARNADAAGNHLRFNNPIYGALHFSLPTTGHRDIMVKYASMRSGSGAYYQFIHYTTDGTNYILFDTIEPTTIPTLYTLDFSGINAVNNNPNFKIRVTFGQGGGGNAGNNRFDNFTMEGNVATPLSLIHYWNFNTTTSLAAHFTPNTSLVNGASIDTFLYSGGSSLVDLAGGTGQGFDANNYNARNSDVPGNHLRFNNPIYGALRFSLPTTGYRDVVVKYAGMRSGSGAYNQLIHYTTDGVNYVFFDTIKPGTAPALYTLDFSAITATDNNADFKIRISFEQGGGGNAGNNRFDNFTMDGYSISGNDTVAPTVLFNPLNNAIDVALNINPTITFNEDVRLLSNVALDNNNADTLIELRLNDSAGAAVLFDASVSGKVITITPNNPLSSNQQYYLGLKANVIEDLLNNAITGKPSVKFTTIAPQTLFAAGDLVPVAYRMNATDADDEVALLTLVDILPGTKINLTDAKFTTNTPAQCTGGLVWTAPLSGVAAGSVISIKNDGGIANIGTLTGGNFGLSSGGDQLIVYTGTNANPNYITALSSNAWLASNTTCSGSNSMRPAGLTDGLSSIQFSTTKGNVAGNTTNAYYTGSQTGTPAQLRAAILDTINWSGVASGTPSQVWPAWNFPGPPVVISASVINATTLRIIFSEDLDAASATNTANFTGIANLASVSRSNNGSLADTLLLNYSVAFAGGSTNVLTVSGVKDVTNVGMIAAYVFSFTYNTSISFATAFASVKEDTNSINIRLNLLNPSVSSVRVVVKGAPYSTAASTDYVLTSHTLNFTGTSSASQTINIPVINDAINEQDEYLVISLETPSGLSLGAISTFTLFIRDNDRLAPAPQKNVALKYVGSFDPSPLNGSTTEIVVYDSASKRLIMTSAIQDRLDIADFSRPDSIVIVKSINMAPYGGITSVTVKNGLIAVASPNANEQLDGAVVFFTINGDSLKKVTVGALPDMITFTPDGKKVLTANEGQPSADYTVDPEGSISVIDLTNGIASLTQSNVTTLLFTAFNAQESTLRAQGVRKLKLSSTISQDFEPEYVTISSDSKKAWATLQENNAVAEIDLQSNTIVSIWPLGMKNYNSFGNGFDASDNSGFVHLSNYPVKAFYIPDAIASYNVSGNTYLVTANEGDEKEYGGLNERTTVGASTTLLDSAKFLNGKILKENHHLGRLRMTNLSGDTDGDGDYDEIHVVGSRSFSIWNAATKTQVYDSGDDFERITSTDPAIAAQFNADNEGNGPKSRSRAKGPEPEGLTVAHIDGKPFAFIALERVGGVMVYDITNPAAPVFQDYKNNRSLTSFSGDHGPEGITYISPSQSPDGKAYITVANELSGTISVYEVNNNMPKRVEFAQERLLINENEGPKVISLALDFPASQNGTVTIKAFNGSGINTNEYLLNPSLTSDTIVIPVTKNSAAASFSFTPVDDQLDENNENITFQIIRASSGISIGAKNLFVITIADNDTTIPVRIANFTSAEQVVAENAGTINVNINLSAPLNGAGRIVLKANKSAMLTSADFTSNPAITGDSLTLNIADGANTATFSVTVINDTEDETNEQLSFTIARTEGNLSAGATSAFTLTILDDDTLVNSVKELFVNGKAVIMYPNPNNKGEVYFNEAIDAELYDLQGKLLLTASKTRRMSVNGFSKGVYYIRMNGVMTKKLILE